MIISMTGFGRASKSLKKMTIAVEMRSINSKFMEITPRLPVIFIDKEPELKELIAKSISRGKIYVSVTVEKSSQSEITLVVQPGIVKHYFSLLSQMKKAAGIKEDIKIEHLLKFSEIFKADENAELADYWDEVKKVVQAALKDLYNMKLREGKVLEKDILSRINQIDKKLGVVAKISDKNIKDVKQKLLEKVESLIQDKTVIDNNRLEMELVMLTDKMDITEEVIRAKSHLEYFKKNIRENGLSGRRLNFLVQEINREINTIASKSNNSSISQSVVEMKEELEKIKEQLQNIE
jgi:uncharacterized protein (TIGR00255 family)